MRRFYLIALILFSISLAGCAPCEPVIVKVPVKCQVDLPPEPNIDNARYDDNASIIRKALRNYTQQKEYAEKLRATIDACR